MVGTNIRACIATEAREVVAWSLVYNECFSYALMVITFYRYPIHVMSRLLDLQDRPVRDSMEPHYLPTNATLKNKTQRIQGVIRRSMDVMNDMENN